MVTVLLHTTSPHHQHHHHHQQFKIEDTDITTINGLVDDKQASNDSSEYEYANDSFYGMITNNEVFIDKSLLIKDIIRDKSKVSFITCPSGLGKTINLDMLKCFLKMEVNNNGNKISPNSTIHYHFFKNGKFPVKGKMLRLNKTLLISRYNKIIETTLGQYPLVFINFNRFKAKSRKNYFISLKKTIANSFREHRYILKAWQNRTDKEMYLKKFNKYLYQQSSIRELQDSIFFLCRILHDHFKQRVIVLIDQTDLPINELVFLPNTATFKDEAIEIYVKILYKALKNNPFLRRALMTGKSPIAFGKEFDNIEYYEFMNNDYLDKYFGFSKTEVELLFHHYGIERDLRHEAYQYYNGYEHKSHPTQKIFSSLSITKFIQEGQCKPYSMQPISSHILEKFKKTAIFVHMFVNLMVRKPHYIGTLLGLSPSPVQLYETVWNFENPNPPHRYEFAEEVIAFYGIMNQYMMDNGYISWGRYGSTHGVTVKIPNDEVHTAIKQDLYSYFKKITKHDSHSKKARVRAQNVWNEFLTLDNVNQTTIKNLQTVSNEFLYEQPSSVKSLRLFYFPHIITYPQEKYTQLEITSLINPDNFTFLDIESINVSWSENSEEGQSASDIITLLNQSTGTQKIAIIEFKFNRTKNDTYHQAKGCEIVNKLLQKFRHATSIKYITCRITEKKNVALTASIIPFHWYENDTFYQIPNKCYSIESQNKIKN